MVASEVQVTYERLFEVAVRHLPALATSNSTAHDQVIEAAIGEDDAGTGWAFAGWRYSSLGTDWRDACLDLARILRDFNETLIDSAQAVFQIVAAYATVDEEAAAAIESVAERMDGAGG